MTFLTIRVPESLKRKMRSVRGVNWSEVTRTAIEQKVKEEMKKQREKNRESILEAVEEQDQIAKILKRKEGVDWESVKVIRHWREHRYSSSTHR